MSSPPSPSDPPDDLEDRLWVASHLDRGHYRIRYQVGALEWLHTPSEAQRYARAVIRVAQCAAHDAAVLQQLGALGVATEVAALFVAQELRQGRPGFDHAGTRPLRYSPIVSATSGLPIVQMEWTEDGQPRAAQLDATQATMHAVHVLEVAAVTDLDDAYYRALVGGMALGEVRARAAVDDLARFRHSAADT